MKVAVVHNSLSNGVINHFGQPCPEKYGKRTISLVVEALEKVGHEVALYEGDKHLLAALEEFMPPDAQGRPSGMVFNLAYGIQGECRYTHIPAMLELAGIPYTGSTPLGHALALDKVVTKDLIQAAGVSTPAYRVLSRPSDPAPGLRFPVIVKPRHESTSFGLEFVTEPRDLPEAVERVIETYQQDALVEEYIDGREVCVGLLGNGRTLEALAMVEQDFGERSLRLVTYDDKYHRSAQEPEKICPAPIESKLAEKLRRISIDTFRACHTRDYSRVDIRIDSAGQPYVLEINSMASLGPGGSYVLAALRSGYDFAALVNRILDVAHRRYFGSPAPREASLDHDHLVVHDRFDLESGPTFREFGRSSSTVAANQELCAAASDVLRQTDFS